MGIILNVENKVLKLSIWFCMYDNKEMKFMINW